MRSNRRKGDTMEKEKKWKLEHPILLVVIVVVGFGLAAGGSKSVELLNNQQMERLSGGDTLCWVPDCYCWCSELGCAEVECSPCYMNDILSMCKGYSTNWDIIHDCFFIDTESSCELGEGELSGCTVDIWEGEETCSGSPDYSDWPLMTNDCVEE